MKPATVEEPDEDNKLDFDLLMRQLSTKSISAPSTPSSSDTASVLSSYTPSDRANEDVWPLRLNTLFIEHYIFGDVIGNGSYAEVRECVDTRNLERCAVKIINKNYLRRQNPLALCNQMQEIRLLKRFKHPNIIAMKECLFKGPKIYIVLEHCTFVLHDLLNEQIDNKLCPNLTRCLFHQLISGINYLHSIGIVHRDIKPQNLLITTCGALKIIDFGVSHVLPMWSQNDLCSNYEGSPLFQAPEVVSGQAQYAGFKVDIWSAGVTLYLMLFGQYPFIDEALLGLYDKILSDDLVIPVTEDTNDLPCQAVVTDLLFMMLEKVHTKRAFTEQILNHPWLKLQANSTAQNEHSEFIDLATSNSCSATDQTYDSAQQPSFKSDIYKSMSVLPYLHNHHFPNLSVMKVKRDNLSGAASPVATSPKFSPGAASPAPSISVSPSPVSSSGSSVDPHEMIADRPIEWGTEEQYNLLKVPPIRANRVRHSRRRRRRQRRKAAARRSQSQGKSSSSKSNKQYR